MHEVGVDVHGVEIRATPHRAESRTQRLWTCEITRVQFEADDLEIIFLETLVAKATHFDGDGFCQLLRQIANVPARSAIDIRRVLVSQKQDLHRVLPRWSRVCLKGGISRTGACNECRHTYFARTRSTGISTA